MENVERLQFPWNLRRQVGLSFVKNNVKDVWYCLLAEYNQTCKLIQITLLFSMIFRYRYLSLHFWNKVILKIFGVFWCIEIQNQIFCNYPKNSKKINQTKTANDYHSWCLFIVHLTSLIVDCTIGNLLNWNLLPEQYSIHLNLPINILQSLPNFSFFSAKWLWEINSWHPLRL